MKTTIQVIGGKFVYDGKTFNEIIANYFEINDRLIICQRNRKTRELKVEYQTINKKDEAVFEEVYPQQETKRKPITMLEPNMFDENDEIHFRDPDQLFTKIIAQKTWANTQMRVAICTSFFCV